MALAAAKVIKMATTPPKEKKEPKAASKLDNAVGAFKDWVTSPGGIITIIGFIALVWLISRKADKKAAAA